MTNLRQKLEQIMTSNKNDEDKARKPFITVKDLVIFAALFVGIQLWQQRDLLTSDGSIAAPHFTLPSLTGGPITFNSSNNKPALFYFFAPWCTICHVSIENLGTLKKQIEENKIDVFIIALDYNGVEEVEQFVADHDLVTDVLLGTNEQMRDFQISAFPTYYIADAKGNLQWASIGYSASLGIKVRVELVLD